MKLTFWGAAGVVTGSMHLLESNGKRILLDCGMYQGRRQEAEKINRDLPFDAKTIDAVVLSHAHIDHSGNLPLLVKNGFRGPIYATPASIELCNSMLRDTAHIAESDATFVNRQHPGDTPVKPLYTAEDVETTLPLFRPVPYHQKTGIAGDLTMESYDAGHILGSSSILLTDGTTRLIFSGDVGRPGLPIIRDPEKMPPADYLIMESTYGAKTHPQEGEAPGKLEAIVNRTVARGGKLVVPAFAVGRTQQIVLILHQLIDAKRIAPVPVYVDSLLAVNVTEVFQHHPECFDQETAAFFERGEDPFGFQLMRYIRTAEDSKKLNGLKTPFIVISPSGMCEAGRVLHHLRNSVGDSRNTVLLTGYQAENTLGRKLKDGCKQVRIFGVPTNVSAEIESLDELSGHADAGELLTWMSPITSGLKPGLKPGLKKVFLVHGETDQSAALSARIEDRFHVAAVPVQRGQSFDLV